MGIFKVDQIHHRVLIQYFKSAWREGTVSLDSDCAPLRAARTYRDECWWQTLLATSSQRKRFQHGCLHRRSGHIVAWEDLLVMVFGCEWRFLRQQCQSFAEWMGKCSFFVETICTKWELPVVPPVKSIVPPLADVRVKILATFANMPKRPRHTLDRAGTVLASLDGYK